ncbi:TPA: hypothetical protein ACKN6K_002134, partial [Neisseria gonorrhoeae]
YYSISQTRKPPAYSRHQTLSLWFVQAGRFRQGLAIPLPCLILLGLLVLVKIPVATRMSDFFRRISVRNHSVSGFAVLKNSS